MYVKESVYIYDLWSASFVFLWSSFVFYSCQLAPCYYISLDDKSPWRTYAILSPYIHLHFNQIAITMAHINSTLSIFSNCCFKSFWPWRQQSMTSYKWILRESSPTAELYVYHAPREMASEGGRGLFTISYKFARVRLRKTRRC